LNDSGENWFYRYDTKQNKYLEFFIFEIMQQLNKGDKLKPKLNEASCANFKKLYFFATSLLLILARSQQLSD